MSTEDGAKVKAVSEVGVSMFVAEYTTEVNMSSLGTGPESLGPVVVYVTYNGSMSSFERYGTHYGEKAVPGMSV